MRHITIVIAAFLLLGCATARETSITCRAVYAEFPAYGACMRSNMTSAESTLRRYMPNGQGDLTDAYLAFVDQVAAKVTAGTMTNADAFAKNEAFMAELRGIGRERSVRFGQSMDAIQGSLQGLQDNLRQQQPPGHGGTMD